MTPTDTIGDDILLYHGDCREVMATILPATLANQHWQNATVSPRH